MDKRVVWAILFIVNLIFLSCKYEKTTNIEKEKMFSLSIGRQEDQVSVFDSNGNISYIKSKIYMRNNMMYIIDGNTLKLMEFTPFGDLTFLLFNKHSSLNPIIVKPLTDLNDLSSRSSKDFNFNSISDVMINSQNIIFIQDSLEKSQDRDLDGIPKQNIIRKFSKTGNLLGYIGEDGLTTKPFGIIGGMYLKNDDSIFLYTQESSSYNFFHFLSSGEFLNKGILNVSDIPILKEFEGSDVFLSVMSIYPDMSSDFIYIYVSYYKKDYDEKNRYQGITSLYNYIYKYNYENKSFVDVYKLDYKDKDGNKILYEIIGVDENNNIYFLARQDSYTFSLLVINSKGENILTDEIFADRQETSLYENIRVSRKGIVYGIITYDDRYDIYWWRTDKLIN